MAGAGETTSKELSHTSDAGEDSPQPADVSVPPTVESAQPSRRLEIIDPQTGEAIKVEPRRSRGLPSPPSQDVVPWYALSVNANLRVGPQGEVPVLPWPAGPPTWGDQPGAKARGNRRVKASQRGGAKARTTDANAPSSRAGCLSSGDWPQLSSSGTGPTEPPRPAKPAHLPGLQEQQAPQHSAWAAAALSRGLRSAPSSAAGPSAAPGSDQPRRKGGRGAHEAKLAGRPRPDAETARPAAPARREPTVSSRENRSAASSARQGSALPATARRSGPSRTEPDKGAADGDVGMPSHEVSSPALRGIWALPPEARKVATRVRPAGQSQASDGGGRQASWAAPAAEPQPEVVEWPTLTAAAGSKPVPAAVRATAAVAAKDAGARSVAAVDVPAASRLAKPPAPGKGPGPNPFKPKKTTDLQFSDVFSTLLVATAKSKRGSKAPSGAAPSAVSFSLGSGLHMGPSGGGGAAGTSALRPARCAGAQAAAPLDGRLRTQVRGKEREGGRKKKPSALKKRILIELMQKYSAASPAEASGAFSPSSVNPMREELMEAALEVMEDQSDENGPGAALGPGDRRIHVRQIPIVVPCCQVDDEGGVAVHLAVHFQIDVRVEEPAVAAPAEEEGSDVGAAPSTSSVEESTCPDDANGPLVPPAAAPAAIASLADDWDEANGAPSGAPADDAVGAVPHLLARPPEATHDPHLVRDYCMQAITPELNGLVSELLTTLARFQRKTYLNDPIRAQAKRRLVCGLREGVRGLRANKVRMVIVAHNIERIESAGGLDDMMVEILKLARYEYHPSMALEVGRARPLSSPRPTYLTRAAPSARGYLQERETPVPVVFAHSRRVLSRLVAKSMRSSVVAIFNYDGANEIFKKVLDAAQDARNVFNEWQLLPRQQASARARREHLRAVHGDDGLQKLEDMQRECYGRVTFPADRRLVLEPKKPKSSSSGSNRRHVDPCLLDLVHLDAGPTV